MAKHNKTMDKKLLAKAILIRFMLMLVLVLSIQLASAELTHKQNTDLKFSITSNFADQCILTTINTPTDVLFVNQNGTKTSQTFNFTISSGNFSELGNYRLNIECADSTQKVTEYEDVEVTPNGQVMGLSQAILFGFVFLIIIGMLVFSIMGLSRANDVSWLIFYICATYIMSFCMFFVAWLFSSNYLWQTPILASVFWIIWLIMSICFFPFIIGVSGYILKLQAEALMVDNYVSKGYSQEDAKSLAKTKRKR
jgi:hypothetical protein